MPQQGVKMTITPLLIAMVVEYRSESHRAATSIDAYANVMTFRSRFDHRGDSGVIIIFTPCCGMGARGPYGGDATIIRYCGRIEFRSLLEHHAWPSTLVATQCFTDLESMEMVRRYQIHVILVLSPRP